jgi:hypothetical protein
MVKGTKAEKAIKILQKTPLKQRKKVTLNTAGNMGLLLRNHSQMQS